jgi:uncharacterized protein (DUF1778 family)
MTDLAAELDQKLAKMEPAKARVLERLVREAMALADAPGTASPTANVDAASDDLLNLRVYPLALMTEDFERLHEAMDQPPRELPRLRELLSQPGRLRHA